MGFSKQTGKSIFGFKCVWGVVPHFFHKISIRIPQLPRHKICNYIATRKALPCAHGRAVVTSAQVLAQALQSRKGPAS